MVLSFAPTDLDRQAVLLLCSSFGQLASQLTQPLSITEYNRLATCLKNCNLRPADLLSAKSPDFWLALEPQLDWERIFALLRRGGLMGVVLERWQSQGLWILYRFEEHYPPRLKQRLKEKAPPILYGIGNPSLLHQPGLAIVGSRNPNEDALEYTQRVGEICARDGWIVISGAAKGIDRAAMLGCIHAGGQAIGVVADSLLKAAVSSYYRPALSQGSLALITPFDPEAPWLVSRAMQRNKYIYCLAEAALVVSSETDGGTWQGATEALKHHPSWQVPVFIRTEGDLPPGNPQLLTQGGISFPTSPWVSPLKELLSSCLSNDDSSPQQPPPTSDCEQLDVFQWRSLPPAPDANGKEPSPPAKDSKLPPLPTPRDIYTAVLPFILAQLRQPKGLKELAAALDIKEGQAKAWLDRAVQEGYIKLNRRKYTTP